MAGYSVYILIAELGGLRLATIGAAGAINDLKCLLVQLTRQLIWLEAVVTILQAAKKLVVFVVIAFRVLRPVLNHAVMFVSLALRICLIVAHRFSPLESPSLFVPGAGHEVHHTIFHLIDATQIVHCAAIVNSHSHAESRECSLALASQSVHFETACG